MKTAILCYNRHGADGREPGIIVHMKEFKDDEPVSWGPNTACVPPNWFTIVLKNQTIRDLPDSWKEFGGHRSRIVLNKAAMSVAEVQALEKDEKPEVPIVSMIGKIVDKGNNWSPSAVSMEEPLEP